MLPTPAARGPLAPLAHDDPHHLGGHRLLARLGSGGMGTVYLARSTAGRTVALKTVHARIAADATFRTRFRLEADAARVIGDRYGARVFGADPLAQTPWLATEYVIGPQLDEAVAAAGPLPEPVVRALGADLARALGRLHASDVVHRDLKPSNIMVTAAGPKVIDFGIARALGDERLTGVGVAAGTPAFMSPEQAAGLEHTPAGDVFALAGVLLFAAAGHGPFGGGQAADLLYRVRYAEPDLGGVPQALAPLLARCLDKDPARRPTTAGLAELLAPGAGVFADGLPQPVLADIARRAAAVWQEPPPRLPAPAGEPATVPDAGTTAGGGMSRRRLLTVTGAAAGGVALATGGGLWAWLSARGQEEESPPALGQPPAALWETSAVSAKPGSEPLRTGDELIATAGMGAFGFNPQKGKPLSDRGMVGDAWRIATDGKVLYGLRDHEVADKALVVVRLPQGGRGQQETSVRLAAFDSAERLNQILCVDGDTVFLCAKSVAGGQWFVLAASLKSGGELWRQPTAPPAEASLAGSLPCVVRAKTLRVGLLVCRGAGRGDSLRLSVHDPATGAERWTVSLPAPGARPHRLATDEDHVYLGAATLQALRLTDGSAAWSFGAGRKVGELRPAERQYGIPTVRDGVVYAVEGTRGIVAVDARTGKVRWTETPLKDARPDRDLAPVAGTEQVYSMDRTGLRAIDVRSHRAVWRYKTSAITVSPDPDPAVNQLYIRDDTRVLALPTR
ncbi:protein kinase [Streptomyces sp. NPDC060031]|uniref:serine/threonine-protein kinase n=1 Tax=Streptomyces sp. NPDC060031 TaxID=3347043 RepID=UPI003688361D